MYIVHYSSWSIVFICLESFDEVNDFPNGADLGSFFFRDLAVEFFFDGHDQFDGIEGISTKIGDEGGFRDNLVGFNSELFDDQFLDLVVVKSSVCSSERSRCESGSASKKSEGKDGLEHDGIFG